MPGGTGVIARNLTSQAAVKQEDINNNSKGSEIE